MSFFQSLKSDIKNDVRLYFAPIIGAYRQVKIELNRSKKNSKRT